MEATNPVTIIRKPKTPQRRQRFLTAAEIKIMLQESRKANRPNLFPLCIQVWTDLDSSITQEYLAPLGVVSDPPLVESYNVALGQDMVVILNWPETGALEYGLLRWGLLPFWSKFDRRDFH